MALFGFGKPKKVAPTQTVGQGGTTIYGGFIQSSEQNAKLTGRERYKTYGEILANVSIVAAGTRYFQQLVAKADWKVEAAKDGGEEAKRYAELIEDILFDMTTPWPRFVRRASLYRFYGFSIHEWTAVKREDGTIGMKDIESRPQHTIEQWDVDESGTLLGVGQRSVNDGSIMYLPREKLVYCVDDSLTDSPEGLGLFRHVVDAANRLQRYEQLEGFGFETDLRGIPVGRAPFLMLDDLVRAGKLSKEDRELYLLGMKNFIQGHIKSPQLGLLLDSITYQSQDEAGTPSNVPQWSMELLKGDAGPHVEVAAAIERLNREIARVLGVENLLLGATSTGSLALSRDKSNNFATLVDATNNDLTHQFMADIVNPLFRLNGWPMELRPKLKTSATQYRDIEQVTAALRDMATAGAVLSPDDPAIGEVRDMLGLTKQDPAKIELQMQAAADVAAASVPGATGGSNQPGNDNPNGEMPQGNDNTQKPKA